MITVTFIYPKICCMSNGDIQEPCQCDVGWLVGFVALRPKSTAMVIAGRSVHLTTPFPGQA